MANVFQTLNDSAAGVVIGTALHTLGAIGLLGGLIGYVAWHRHLHRGHHHAKVLNFATFLTYISILANLLGGFMRTYETGHPHITDFATSAWVRAISIKHVFIFLAMAAAIVLFERIAPRHVQAMKAGRLAEESMTTHALGVLLVALGIVVSALLGAVSTVLPVAAADDGEDMDDGHDDHNATVVRYVNATGQLSGFLPTQPVESRATFDVAAGTRALNATLVWEPAQFCLRVTLLRPGQTQGPAGACEPNPGEGLATSSIADPPPGTWTYVIDAAAPVQATWTLSIAMPQTNASGSLFATVTIPPSNPAQPTAFYEINTQMPKGGTIHWDWTSSAVLHFNVHSHFDDEVQDYVDEDTTGGRSSYTNDRAGGYSLFWTNSGTSPVTLTYEVWGDFSLDSIST